MSLAHKIECDVIGGSCPATVEVRFVDQLPNNWLRVETGLIAGPSTLHFCGWEHLALYALSRAGVK